MKRASCREHGLPFRIAETVAPRERRRVLGLRPGFGLPQCRLPDRSADSGASFLFANAAAV